MNTRRTTVEVMINDNPVMMHSLGSLPLKVAIEFDKLTRTYGDNPPIESLADLMKRCVVEESESDLIYDLTSDQFKDLIEEWAAKSAE